MMKDEQYVIGHLHKKIAKQIVLLYFVNTKFNCDILNLKSDFENAEI